MKGSLIVNTATTTEFLQELLVSYPAPWKTVDGAPHFAAIDFGVFY